MAIFNKDASTTPDSKGNTTPQQGEAALSIIAAGTKITGDIETTGVIKIEGAIQGSIRNARQVLVGRQGEVKGDVNAKEVVIGGKIDGNVRASERVEVQGTSLVNGDIATRSIVVLEGGKINGSVKMEEQGVVRALETPAKSSPVAVVR